MGVFVCLAQLVHCALRVQQWLFDCLDGLRSQPHMLPKVPLTLALGGTKKNFVSPGLGLSGRNRGSNE